MSNFNSTFSSGFKKIASNTGYLFSEKVINIGLALVVGIYVARYLGPEDFGLWQYAQSLVGLFTAVATLGTTQIVTRDLVNGPAEREGDILGTSFALMLGAGVITAISVIIIGLWLNNEAVTQWLIIIASANLILQSFRVFDYWFQSKVLSKYSVYSRTAGRIVASALKVLFIVLSLNVIYFAFTIIAASTINGIFWIYSYRSQKRKLSTWSFDFGYAKSLLKDAWPLILSGISVAIYMKIDLVMLKSMMNASAVGNYAVAVRISELWYFIPASICISVFPSIINTKKNDLEKYKQRLQYLYDVLAAMAIAIAIPMTFLSDYIVSVLFGAAYSSAGNVLAVHIWAGVFVFLGVARSRWIINENYQRYGMIFTVSGAVANVALNLWLIPILGIMGAAWATLISYMISAWLMAIIFKQTRITFYMLGKAMGKTILIFPILKSAKNILQSAKR